MRGGRGRRCRPLHRLRRHPGARSFGRAKERHEPETLRSAPCTQPAHRLRRLVCRRGEVQAVRLPLLGPLGGASGAAGRAGTIHGGRRHHRPRVRHVREPRRGRGLSGVLPALCRRRGDRRRRPGHGDLDGLDLTLDETPGGGRTPRAGWRPTGRGHQRTAREPGTGAGSRASEGSAPARVFRLKRRQDPTDDRRPFYRAGSTMIRPRPRLSR